MYLDKTVIAYTPFGRKETASILFKYLEREHKRGLLDEWMLCLNFDRHIQANGTVTGSWDPRAAGDLEYAHELAAAHDWINTYDCPGPSTPGLRFGIPDEWMHGYRHPKQLNTMRFFFYMQDRNAIYVRFDDDIVWMHNDALATLVDRKNTLYRHLAVFPMILHNAICSSILQAEGLLTREFGQVMPHAVDPVGWESYQFAEDLHRRVLSAIKDGTIDDWLLPIEHVLGRRQQFSVSCFAISGNEYADLNGVLNWDEEEHWLTQHQPGIVMRDNIICGQALVAHFSFYPHRAHLLKVGLLDEYAELAENIPDEPLVNIRQANGTIQMAHFGNAELDKKGDEYYETLA